MLVDYGWIGGSSFLYFLSARVGLCIIGDIGGIWP